MNNDFSRWHKLAGLLTEAQNWEARVAEGDTTVEAVETEKKRMTRAEAKRAIKDAILAEMGDGGEKRHITDISQDEWDYMKPADYKNIDFSSKEFPYEYKLVKAFMKKLNTTHPLYRLITTLPYEEMEKFLAALNPLVTADKDNKESNFFDKLASIAKEMFGYKEPTKEELTEASDGDLDRMHELVDQNDLMMMLAGIDGVISSLYEEGFEYKDIADYIMDYVERKFGFTIGGLREAKGEEDAAEEVDVTADETADGEEVAVDTTVDSEVDADMAGGEDLDAGSSEAKKAFNELTDAYRAAKELGDEKLVRQLANTITYFNKNIILRND